MKTAKFWNGPIYQVVRKMKASGNQPGIVHHWKAMVQAWADREESADAAAVRAMLPLWQERPFYTAAELAPIMPGLAAALCVATPTGAFMPVMSPARLSNHLRMAGLPHHQIGNKLYFLVEHTHRMDEIIPMIEEFHNAQY